MTAFLPPEHRRIFRRRVRRYQGSTWSPPSMSADPEDGLWCRRHKKRHGYMTMQVGFQKDNRTGKWSTLWMCPDTGEVLGETVVDSDGVTNTDTTGPGTNDVDSNVDSRDDGTTSGGPGVAFRRSGTLDMYRLPA